MASSLRSGEHFRTSQFKLFGKHDEGRHKLHKMPPLQQDLETLLPRSDADGFSIKTTPDGDAALKKGSEIYRETKGAGFFGIMPPSEDKFNELGKEKLFLWFGTFYKRLMTDPRMAVLFDTSNEEANVSAAEHGRRLALALLTRWTGDRDYYTQVSGGQHMFQRLREAHDRAKGCPMRSPELRSRGFTKSQRDSWLGHLWLAATDCNIPSGLQHQVVHHLGTVIGVYGPFVE